MSRLIQAGSRLTVALIALLALSLIVVPVVEAARVHKIEPTEWEGEYQAEVHGFLPDEDVSIRLIAPDDHLIKLEHENASKRGRVRFTFFIPRYEIPGDWTLRVVGVTSDRKAKATFEVPPRGPNVDLAVTPSAGAAGSVFMLEGAGFDPGERITAWLTRPDGQGVEIGETLANETGQVAFAAPIPADGPTGDWLAVAYGRRSDRLGAAAFRVV